MEIKERILEGAGKLFVTEGIRRVTMDYVAKKLGVSKRTIYENFADKTDLLKACLKRMYAINDENFRCLKEKSTDVMDIMVGSLRFGVSAIKKINPQFFEDLEIHYPLIWDEMVAIRRNQMMKDFEKLLLQGAEQKIFRDSLNVKMVAKIFIEQMNMMGRKEIFPPDEYPTTELFETLFINFTRGISTHEGINRLEELLQAEN